MLENAFRQLILVVLVTAGALAALVFVPPHLGLDLSGGVQLIYEVDVAKAETDGTIPKNATEEEITAVVDQTVSIIAERIDPTGTLEAVVTRRGETGILIELPKMTETETNAVQARIENLGSLELRILANDTYNKHGVTFDLEKEKDNLKGWLDADDGVNRKAVMEDPSKIRLYNNLTEGEHHKLSQELRWYPKVLGPSVDDPERWSQPESWNYSGPVQGSVAVPAFTAEDWNGGRVKEGVSHLVEFLPINMDEESFRGEDIDPSSIHASHDELGKPCITYKMRTDASDRYAVFSKEYIKQRCAIILNGEVHSAPTFEGEIRGRAQITSRDFTSRQVNELVRTLRTGSLKVKPILQSKDVIGATLGARSIKLALYSMIGGSIAVLLFILAYYRLAGLVAFAGLMLNMVMILGVVGALRATLTLPGLAGLVLTMGMAIDANILIYERIREEVARGKELLQACRTGFDRAIVTIVDANLTTFIAGLVLYNVGVGPIRGFAVTLMVGIITTLFTAFFVSRLVFHYLLESKRLKGFNVAKWLTNANFDFIKIQRPVFTISALVVVGSIILFAVLPADTKYAIDFTGGANLKVTVAQPMTAQEVRDLLGSDKEFDALFPHPIVNTFGEQVENGKARQFAIRVKLTDELRDQINAARTADPDNYKPPYFTELHRVLADRLVDDAYSDARVDPNLDRPNFAFASIDLHFSDVVKTDEVVGHLKGDFPGLTIEALPPEGSTLQPGEKLELAKDFNVQFDVSSDTKPENLFTMVETYLTGVKDLKGEPAPLSQPIPESSEIGGRMVGELRNSAISAILISLFAIVMYIRVRFHEVQGTASARSSR